MKKLSILVALIMANSAASAQNYSDYKSQVCAKVKQCRLGSLLTNDVPEPMQDFVVQMVDSQCLTIAGGFEQQILDAGLEGKAKKCITTLNSQSCESLLASKGEVNTEACEVFLNSADKAGIDFSKVEF
jgi:hypothetical protein